MVEDMPALGEQGSSGSGQHPLKPSVGFDPGFHCGMSVYLHSVRGVRLYRSHLQELE